MSRNYRPFFFFLTAEVGILLYFLGSPQYNPCGMESGRNNNPDTVPDRTGHRLLIINPGSTMFPQSLITQANC